MPKIYSTFADHPAAQRAVDQMIHGGFATSDVYIDPNWQRDLFAGSGERHGEEGKGVLRSIGHAVASVVGMDTPDADAQPSMQGRRRGGMVVVVDTVGDADTRRAVQLLRGCGGMDVHEAGRRTSVWSRADSAQDEDGARTAEAERSRMVERAMAADHANSGRAWDAEAPRAGAGAADRPPR